jgi:hypothetical protein
MASRAEVFGNGTIRGEGTAIPHHHAIIILVAGVPQRPLNDTGGRVPRQDQGRHAEPPEVDTEIGGVKWAGGTKHLVLYDRQKLDKPRNKLTMPSRTPPGLSARPPARGWGLGLPTAQRTIEGNEAMHMLRKGQLEGGAKGDVLAQNRVINQLFGVAV